MQFIINITSDSDDPDDNFDFTTDDFEAGLNELADEFESTHDVTIDIERE